jgi:hypothetical protein
MHCQNINPKANLRITTPDNTAREHTLAGDCGKFSQPGEHIRVQKKSLSLVTSSPTVQKPGVNCAPHQFWILTSE